MKKLFRVHLLILLVTSCAKSNVQPSSTSSSAAIQDVTQPRAVSDFNMRFYVYLNKAASTNVTVAYQTVDGSAIAGKDYISTSGTLQILANQNQGYIDIQAIGDPTNLRQANLSFKVVLSNPQGCVLGTSSATGTIVTENGNYLPTDNTGYSTPNSYANYTLVWSDEFSGSAVDQSAWSEDTGNGVGGWGNNELEYYTGNEKNVFVSNGNLIIEARKESINGFNYSSARLTTQNKKSFTYGRIDIRAKLPVAKGMWPAIWMLGSNIPSVGWPACGEIDIMELVGTYPNRVTGTMHWSAGGSDAYKNANYVLSSGDYSQKFHVYSIVWKQDTISWYVDDQLFLSTTSADVGTSNYPFNADQFLILNVAVGGNWPGSPDNTTTFPQRMFVDYVRVFQ